MFDNYEWIKEADLDHYQGEWIIVARESVIAHGQDLEKLYKEVDRNYPGEDRITVNVPPEGVILCV